MQVIEPINIDDSVFLSSNVTEDDYGVYDESVTYSAGDRVIVIGVTHKVYESVVGSNLGNDPTTDTNGAYWQEVSATNRWKAFDGVLNQQTENTTSITYSLVAPSQATGLVLFNLVASSVQIEIHDESSPPELIYDSTVDLVDTTSVVDWYSFFFDEVEYDTETMFLGIPIYTGFQVDVTISLDASAGSTAKVGQIVMGKSYVLGETLEDTSIGINDYSSKSRDQFGNATLVERPFSDRTSFRFAMNTQDARRVKRILTRLRSTPAVYFVDGDSVSYGTTVYGYYKDLDIPLKAAATSFATLEIEGLV